MIKLKNWMSLLLALSLCLPLASCVAETPATTGTETATATETVTATATETEAAVDPKTEAPTMNELLANYQKQLETELEKLPENPRGIAPAIQKNFREKLLNDNYPTVLLETYFDWLTKKLFDKETQSEFLLNYYMGLVYYFAVTEQELNEAYWKDVEVNGIKLSSWQELFDYVATNPHLKGRTVSDTARDIVFLGSHWVSKENGIKMPLPWTVLGTKDNGETFLQCNVILAEMPYYAYVENGRYHAEYQDSPARYWLNQSFYRSVFTEKERKAILLTDLTNEYPEHLSFGGPNTKDYVFIGNYRDVVPFLELWPDDHYSAHFSSTVNFFTPFAMTNGGYEDMIYSGYCDRSWSFFEARYGDWAVPLPVVPCMVIDTTKL